MKMDLWWLILPVGLILIVVAVVIYYINRIRVLSNIVDNAWSQIDVQLKRRFDLVPNLVETVKGYMEHEREAIELVTKARERMMGVTTTKERIEAEGALTQALRTIFALAENYPQLRASENFRLLQEQLEGIENKIAYARQFYNDSVLRFNNLITTIPGSFFAGGRAPREYFEIPEGERAPPRVTFK
jgi:LemA protein